MAAHGQRGGPLPLRRRRGHERRRFRNAGDATTTTTTTTTTMGVGTTVEGAIELVAGDAHIAGKLGGFSLTDVSTPGTLYPEILGYGPCNSCKGRSS